MVGSIHTAPAPATKLPIIRALEPFEDEDLEDEMESEEIEGDREREAELEEEQAEIERRGDIEDEDLGERF